MSHQIELELINSIKLSDNSTFDNNSTELAEKTDKLKKKFEENIKNSSYS
jgi:hypothetical protein